jgi:hypothetical protein
LWEISGRSAATLSTEPIRLNLIHSWLQCPKMSISPVATSKKRVDEEMLFWQPNSVRHAVCDARIVASDSSACTFLMLVVEVSKRSVTRYNECAPSAALRICNFWKLPVVD